MLGSEYNWLISFTRPAEGPPKITLVGTSWITLIVAASCFLALILPVEPTHLALTKAATPAPDFKSPTKASPHQQIP